MNLVLQPVRLRVKVTEWLLWWRAQSSQIFRRHRTWVMLVSLGWSDLDPIHFLLYSWRFRTLILGIRSWGDCRKVFTHFERRRDISESPTFGTIWDLLWLVCKTSRMTKFECLHNSGQLLHPWQSSYDIRIWKHWNWTNLVFFQWDSLPSIFEPISGDLIAFTNKFQTSISWNHGLASLFQPDLHSHM
jgi:hypothetical protein